MWFRPYRVRRTTETRSHEANPSITPSNEALPSSFGTCAIEDCARFAVRRKSQVASRKWQVCGSGHTVLNEPRRHEVTKEIPQELRAMKPSPRRRDVCH